MTHTVRQEEDTGWRRWVCDGCEFATEWVAYTNPGHAADAIRHQIQYANDEGDMQ